MKLAIRIMVTVFLLAVVTLLITTSVVDAQETPPEPYNGLINPFAWDDAETQSIGGQIYAQKCQACHGISGNNIANANFSLEGYSAHLETNQDYYYWVVSEGAMDKGMPGYSSSLSEDERWQVLTYVWSLESIPQQVIEEPSAIENGLLQIHVPKNGISGEQLTIGATLVENQQEPVRGAKIEFFTEADFFATGLMKIGESITDENGEAEFNFVSRQSGEIRVIAHYQNLESSTTIALTTTDDRFYKPEVGINVPVLGEEVSIGPPERLKLGNAGEAPLPVLRLPTGHLAWLAPLLFAAMCIWIVYSYVVYQLVRIPEQGDTEGINIRKFPRWLLIIVSILGFLLMVMLVLGPESNMHLLQ